MKNEIEKHIESLSTKEYVLFNSICDKIGITLADLIGQRRFKTFANARKIATHILYKNGYSLHHIGKIISIVPKDHTTIIYQRECARNHYHKEIEFRNIVDSLFFDFKSISFTSLKYKPC